MVDVEELSEKFSDWNSPRNLKKIAAVLALLAAAVLFFLPGFASERPSVRLIVSSLETGEPVEGASALLLADGEVIGFKRTRASGAAEFRTEPSSKLRARVEAPGFETREVTSLKQRNDVALALATVNSQAGGLKEPSQGEKAFDLPQGSEDAGISAEAMRKLESQAPSKPPFEAPEVNAPDCQQITPEVTATPTPAASALPSATAPPDAIPPQGSLQQTQFSLGFGESKLLGEEEARFYDYSADGKVRLRVYTKAGDYSVVLSPQAGVELAAGTLEFVSTSGEPPTALFKFLWKTGGSAAGGTTTPTPAGGAGGGGGSQAQQTHLKVYVDSPAEEAVLVTRTPLSGSAEAANGVFMVEVSSDGGRNWVKARGGSKWAAEIDYSQPGAFRVKARVTDCKGNARESVERRLYGAACKALVYHGPHQEKYDLVLVPSKYDGDSEKFASDAESALETVFSTPPFNTPGFYSKFNVFFYNGEALCRIAGSKPPENRAWKCDVPAAYFESCPFADQSVVFVNSNLRAGKSGNPIVASAGESEILLHELGHSMLGLADEYCCDGGYWESGEQPNIFDSREKCEEESGRKCFDLGNGWTHIQVERGAMEALEKKFFDESDLPAFEKFLKKYE